MCSPQPPLEDLSLAGCLDPQAGVVVAFCFQAKTGGLLALSENSGIWKLALAAPHRVPDSLGLVGADLGHLGSPGSWGPEFLGSFPSHQTPLWNLLVVLSCPIEPLQAWR